MFVLWQQCCWEKGQDILPSDARAWSGSPHTTLSNSWAKFFWADISPFQSLSLWPCVPRRLFTSFRLSNISEMLLDSSSRSLVYSAAASLVSAFYLNQGAAPVIVGGWRSNLLAGQEMKLPAFYGAARWDHRDDRSRWRCLLRMMADFRLSRRGSRILFQQN